MFELQNNLDDIFKHLNPCRQIIPEVSSFPQDLNYVEFLKTCADTEITADIHLFGYEKALKENQYLAQNFPILSRQVWMIGRTGQGDEWFMDRQSFEMLFYDHDLGFTDALNFHSLQSMQINFFQFLQFALLLQECEEYIDRSITDNEFAQFEQAVKQIDSALFSNYPFNYQ
ncbi:hypothetical protein [Acinetobacter bereziniae]|uniref:hypothetical protein n=1 Tax=Acinetobacter bereziniae TaxID=106648 RepID=UPI00073EBAA3|nr:hypothetical protein [Acinetobacter bereziniae]RSZ25828.1 hypothetical protein NDM229_007280 [Acinetobacter bereziniae]